MIDPVQIPISRETFDHLHRLSDASGLSPQNYLEQLIQHQAAVDSPAPENAFAGLVGLVESEKTDISIRVTQIMQGFAEKYGVKFDDDE
ncbi:MAG TPA: hypothetical protein VJZ27_07530 [Aggregatilineales bacterium]|nr:hypothetical protein [Aggregatilineales bacterium]